MELVETAKLLDYAGGWTFDHHARQQANRHWAVVWQRHSRRFCLEVQGHPRKPQSTEVQHYYSTNSETTVSYTYVLLGVFAYANPDAHNYGDCVVNRN